MSGCARCGKQPLGPRSRLYCGYACSNRVKTRHPVPIEKRFWDYVDKSAGEKLCWLWTGARDPNGYGRVNVERRSVPTHRVAYYLANGRWPTPVGLHICDNPPCCNPLHIVEGDQALNMRDCARKGRHGQRKLTDAALASIFKRLSQGERAVHLAAEYDVTPGAIRRHVAKQRRSQ